MRRPFSGLWPLSWGCPRCWRRWLKRSDLRGRSGPVSELTADRPAPLLNVWHPAYRHLALEGKRRGCQLILTGHGGDEWLDISPYFAADLLRAGDAGGLYRLWDSWRHSYPLGPAGLRAMSCGASAHGPCWVQRRAVRCAVWRQA